MPTLASTKTPRPTATAQPVALAVYQPPSPTVTKRPVELAPPTKVLQIAAPATVQVASRTQKVVIAARPIKIEQLIGDYDAERKQPTLSQTNARYRLESTDLGVPFHHKDRTYILFGDTFGGKGGDAIGYTTDTNPDGGIRLDFVHDSSGTYKPVIIPGIGQGAFEVPMEGVSVGGGMYIYHTTDARQGPNGQIMGRSVVALSKDDGQTFRYLYDLSRRSFINVQVVPIDSAAWKGVPQAQGQGLMIFGSGDYRRSSVSLAYQPAGQIGSVASIRYWTGMDAAGKPTWSTAEKDARMLFNQPCVGEFSVSFNRFIRKWIMLYNCALPDARGILLRTADLPWGPWTDAQVLFDPWRDNGYCHFMHTSWSFQKCDQVNGPGQENMWGGEYGPYEFRDFAIGNASSTTIYFTMSTWNPYTVVLMKAGLALQVAQ